MKQLVINFFKKNFGTKKMQKIYETLHHVSLQGMNFGNGSDFKESGELYAIQYAKNKLKREKTLTVFDVGANIGNYAQQLSQLFESNTTIHSFEPSEKTFEKFMQNTEGVSNIIANNFGLSDTETSLLLYTNQDTSGIASLYKRNLEHFGISMDKQEEIKLSTVDIYCKNNNINEIHFLKMDIEGNELNALKGAKRMLENNNIHFIQFEFGGCNIDSRTYFQDFYYLLKDKYRIYRILKDGLLEISTYKETYEIFTTINYLAEKR